MDLAHEPPPQPQQPPPWREVARRLLVHARCLGASVEEAEDLVHDTIEVIVSDPGWFSPTRGALISALKVVLRNRWLNGRRSQGVRTRARPRLALVPPAPTPEAPLHSAVAKANRHRFLALLEPSERAVFEAWMQQRSGALRGPEAAAQLSMSHRAYEASKKRLRRRCRAVLEELDLTPGDLFDPPEGGAR